MRGITKLLNAAAADGREASEQVVEGLCDDSGCLAGAAAPCDDRP